MPEGTPAAVSTGNASSSSNNSSAASITTGNQGTQSGEPSVTWGSGKTGEQGNESGDRGNQDQNISTEISDDFSVDDYSDPDAGGADEHNAEEVKLKEAFQKIKEKLKDDPALLKTVKRALGMNSKYAKIPGLETPESAQQMVDRLESLGGIEGIEQETAEAATLWNMLASGDAGILQTLEGEYADGLKKLAPAMWDKLRESDPGTWNHKSAETFMATIQQSGVATALNTLLALPGVKDNPEVKQQVSAIVNAINAVAKVADSQPSHDLTPEARKLQEQRTQLDQEKQQMYNQGVSAKVAPVLGKEATAALKSVMRDHKISAESQKEVLSDVKAEYARLAKEDASFQKNAKALLAASETDKFLRLVEANVKRLMPKAAARVWRKYTGIAGISTQQQQQRKDEGNSRRETGGGGASVGTIKTAVPDPKQIDWEAMRSKWGGRDGADNKFMKERRYMKKGDSRNVYSF